LAGTWCFRQELMLPRLQLASAICFEAHFLEQPFYSPQAKK